MKTNKKTPEYSYSHFAQRLQERYGLEITRDEYERLCHICRIGTMTVVSKEPSNKQTVFSGLLAGHRMKFVWSDERDCITTVLPKE